VFHSIQLAARPPSSLEAKNQPSDLIEGQKTPPIHLSNVAPNRPSSEKQHSIWPDIKLGTMLKCDSGPLRMRGKMPEFASTAIIIIYQKFEIAQLPGNGSLRPAAGAAFHFLPLFTPRFWPEATFQNRDTIHFTCSPDEPDASGWKLDSKCNFDSTNKRLIIEGSPSRPNPAEFESSPSSSWIGLRGAPSEAHAHIDRRLWSLMPKANAAPASLGRIEIVAILDSDRGGP